MGRRYFISILFIAFLLGGYSPVSATIASWNYQRECEYPDAHTVGYMIHRSNASNLKVHGQFGDKTGYVEYRGIKTPEAYNMKLRVRYSKHSSSFIPIQVIIDNQLKASFFPLDMGDWNAFATTGEIDLGNIGSGTHSIRFVSAGQQWGVADLDKFSLVGYPEKKSAPPLVFLPLLLLQDSPWRVRRNGDILEVGYGSGTSFPQCAALHLNDGYFRMVYGVNSGWGTSVIIPPTFWKNGINYQGTPVTATWEEKGDLLIFKLSGAHGGLSFSGQIAISPPGNQSITANVSMTTSGNINLDVRPGEAFKPVMLSSMHISDTMWDTSGASIGTSNFVIPSSSWIISPPVPGIIFGLTGGISAWKTNAPTVEIGLDRSLDITGWVTESTDPNDDNVGFWAASSTVLPGWTYTLKVTP